MKTLMIVLLATTLTLSSALAASLPCEQELNDAIARKAKAHAVDIDEVHDLGVTSKQEVHYSVTASYDQSDCDGVSQTFQIYTKQDSCEVIAIHADGDEECNG